jgi:hypothetical protein
MVSQITHNSQGVKVFFQSAICPESMFSLINLFVALFD